jgi:hypothetical protein
MSAVIVGEFFGHFFSNSLSASASHLISVPYYHLCPLLSYLSRIIISVPYYHLCPLLSFLSPITSPIPGQLTSDDFLANNYIKRHHGIYEPEVRLWTIWIADACMIGGLIFLGFALQDLLPWIATAFAWAIYVFGAV